MDTVFAAIQILVLDAEKKLFLTHINTLMKDKKFHELSLSI
jgi:hypothetical protein